MGEIKRTFWVMLAWLPDCIIDRMPVSWLEQIERAIYDGQTMHEWFHDRVAELQAANRKRDTDTSSEKQGGE